MCTAGCRPDPPPAASAPLPRLAKAPPTHTPHTPASGRAPWRFGDKATSSRTFLPLRDAAELRSLRVGAGLRHWLPRAGYSGSDGHAPGRGHHRRCGFLRARARSPLPPQPFALRTPTATWRGHSSPTEGPAERKRGLPQASCGRAEGALQGPSSLRMTVALAETVAATPTKDPESDAKSLPSPDPDEPRGHEHCCEAVRSAAANPTATARGWHACVLGRTRAPNASTSRARELRTCHLKRQKGPWSVTVRVGWQEKGSPGPCWPCGGSEGLRGGPERARASCGRPRDLPTRGLGAVAG